MLAEAGFQVTLVENNPEVGGLLRSFISSEGYSFDYGTHLLKETGHEDIDRLLLDEVRNNQEEWNQFTVLKNGNYFNHKLNDYSPFIDTRSLDKEIYTMVEKELLSICQSEGDFKNLKEQLSSTFGSKLYSEVFEPILLKFFNTSPENLAVNSQVLVGLSLILIKDPEQTRQLKTIPFNDSRIGFHSFTEGVSKLNNFYPKQGGVGKWIRILSQKLQKHGVQILTSSNITSMNIENKKISSVVIDNKKEVPCDYLIWTIAPALFLRINKQVINSNKPDLLYTTLFHFVANTIPLTQLYYFINFSLNSKIFRITLYSNLQPNQKGDQAPFTVECITSVKLDMKNVSNEIINELKVMKIFDTHSEIKLIHAESLTSGFPVPTTEIQKQSQENLKACMAMASNLILTGKSSGDSFFLNHVVIETYNKIKKLLDGFPGGNN